MFKKMWDVIRGESPERRVQLRKVQIEEEITRVVEGWDGVIEARKDDRKIKIVVDDEGVGLVVMIRVDVQLVDLKIREAQLQTRSAAAQKLQTQAATLTAPRIVGRLNIKLKPRIEVTK